jgi:Flp pilus assembly protein TadG
MGGESGFKIIFYILFSVVFTVIFTDVFRIYAAHQKIADALAQSVDAGLIAGTDQDTRSAGKLEIDLNKARAGVTNILMNNLKLDNRLENRFFTGSQLDIRLQYRNGSPRLESTFKTNIPIYSTKLFGFSEYSITVPKKTPYLTDFK